MKYPSTEERAKFVRTVVPRLVHAYYAPRNQKFLKRLLGFSGMFRIEHPNSLTLEFLHKREARYVRHAVAYVHDVTERDTALAFVHVLINEVRIYFGVCLFDSFVDLKQISGLHRAHVGEIERGESNVTIQTLKVIADTLGVKIADLVKRL